MNTSIHYTRTIGCLNFFSFFSFSSFMQLPWQRALEMAFLWQLLLQLKVRVALVLDKDPA